MIPILYILPEKEVNEMLFFMVNLGHNGVKIIKATHWHIWTWLNMKIIQMFKKTIKKVQLQIFMLQLQKP